MGLTSWLRHFLRLETLTLNETLPPIPFVSRSETPNKDNKDSLDVHDYGIFTLGYLSHSALALLVVAGVVILGYYIMKLIFSYMGSRGYTVKIAFPYQNHLRVGETIVAKITIYETNPHLLRETPCEDVKLESIMEHLKYRFFCENSKVDVQVLTSFSAFNKEAVLFKFSLRKSGFYEIQCDYDWFTLACPNLCFTVEPGPIDLRSVLFHVQNPDFIQVTSDTWHDIQILLHDRYGNTCPVNSDLAEKFQLVLTKSFEHPQEHADPQITQDVEWSFHQMDQNLFMKLKSNRYGVYKAILTFQQKPIYTNNINDPKAFLIVSTTVPQDEGGNLVNSLYGLLSSTTSIKGSLIYVGSQHQDPTDVRLSVGHKRITVSSLLFGVMYIPFLEYTINSRTRVSVTDAFEFDINDNATTLNLKVSDGIQDSIVVAAHYADGIDFLHAFAQLKGHKLQQIPTFEAKKDLMVSKIKGHFYGYLRGVHTMLISQTPMSNLIHSSMENSPSKSSDWYKSFNVTVRVPPPPVAQRSAFRNFVNSIVNLVWRNNNSQNQLLLLQQGNMSSILTKPIPTSVWLDMVVEKLFEEGDLFRPYRGSRRLHPASPHHQHTSATLNKTEMEFAGLILGKCVHDAICFGACVKLAKFKFTKSLLRCLIGVPITYQCLESDHPTVYKKHVLQILDSPDKEFHWHFQLPLGLEGPRDDVQERTNLLPNGDRIKVTSKNKIHYLNLLALYLLKTRHLPRIEEFRNGFYTVIPHSMIADFDEDDLEKIICGGGSEISISNMKEHHRVIMEMMDNSGLSDTDLTRPALSHTKQQKLLRWFWVVVGNLTQKEAAQFLLLSTGSSAVPTCGFQELSPRLTISLTGCQNEPPQYTSSLHQVAIGNHDSFELFEKSFIASLYQRKEENHDLLNEEDESDFDHANDEVNQNQGAVASTSHSAPPSVSLRPQDSEGRLEIVTSTSANNQGIRNRAMQNFMGISMQ